MTATNWILKVEIPNHTTSTIPKCDNTQYPNIDSLHSLRIKFIFHKPAGLLHYLSHDLLYYHFPVFLFTGPKKNKLMRLFYGTNLISI